MNLEDLGHVPFREIRDALKATPHSRRMAGLLVALCPDVMGGAELADSCLSPEFADAAESTTNQEVVLALILAGRFPAHKVRALAEVVILSDAKNKYVDLPETVLAALGSPLLGKRAKELLKEFPSSRYPSMNTVRNALLGNSLVADDCGNMSAPRRGDYFWVFCRNHAAFADIKLKEPSRFLRAVLDHHMRGGYYRESEGDVVRHALVRRGDLTEEIAEELDYRHGNIDTYRELVKTKAHQSLVLSGKVRRTSVLFCDDASQKTSFVTSPAATGEQIIETFTEADSMEARTSLLLAKNCPKSIYVQIAAETNLLSNADFLMESPWAKPFVRTIGKDGFWGAFRAGLL